MPRVGFEPTTTMFERAKTVYVSDPAVAVIASQKITLTMNAWNCFRWSVTAYQSQALYEAALGSFSAHKFVDQ
jgi:hypothetical protein